MRTFYSIDKSRLTLSCTLGSAFCQSLFSEVNILGSYFQCCVTTLNIFATYLIAYEYCGNGFVATDAFVTLENTITTFSPAEDTSQLLSLLLLADTCALAIAS